MEKHARIQEESIAKRPAGSLPRIGVIGAGRAGLSLAAALARAGWPLAGVANRNADSTKEAAFLLECPPAKDGAELAGRAEALIIGTPDDAVESVAGGLAESGVVGPAHTLLHLSGAHGPETLAAASRKGAAVGCLHPLRSFPRRDPGIRLAGTFFSLQGDDRALSLGRWMVESVEGTVLEFPAGSGAAERALYHAGAVAASNFTVCMLNLAADLWAAAGLKGQAADEALLELAGGTLENIPRVGFRGALTGPFARGDLDTIRRHLAALDDLRVSTSAPEDQGAGPAGCSSPAGSSGPGGTSRFTGSSGSTGSASETPGYLRSNRLARLYACLAWLALGVAMERGREPGRLAPITAPATGSSLSTAETPASPPNPPVAAGALAPEKAAAVMEVLFAVLGEGEEQAFKSGDETPMGKGSSS
ncbi:MAG: DUF2520 domain-containing protein [Firmicutes bacterium]|nr:DUF2520 domain-containing protein [Bacillota bacterium]